MRRYPPTGLRWRLLRWLAAGRHVVLNEPNRDERAPVSYWSYWEDAS